MFKFKFHFPVSIEKLENSVDPEKTLVEVKAGHKVSVKDLIAAYNAKIDDTSKSEEVSGDCLIEILNSKGEQVKVKVSELVDAFNAKDEHDDEDEAKKKKLAEEEEKWAMENMSEDEKMTYSKMDGEAKCSYRKNMKERKNAEEKAKKEAEDKQAMENSIKVANAEAARAAAQSNLKTFTVINSRGAIQGPHTVKGTKDSGSKASGAQRGKAYFAKKFKKA